jgi:zinc transporter, ZIP family
VEAGSGALRGGIAWRLWALIPILLLAVVVGLFAGNGDRILSLVGESPPPTDELDLRRVELQPGEVRVLVRNPQRDEVTIALVTIDDAIVPFTTDGPATLGRLRSTTVVVPYDWVPEEPLAVGVTTSTGIQTTTSVAAAVETPTASARGFLGYGVIGLLVGVVPVLLGLLWLPSLRRLDARWLAGFLALTCGLLSFLVVEALFEAFDLQAALPGAFSGPGLVLLGVALSTLGMTLLSSRLGHGSGATGLALALLVAIGIGVHNLGEGLAIGTSFALGELQLGTFFVIGFMVHNVTEGLGIAAPASRERASLLQLGGLALVAGSPAILGAWLGGYATNDTLAVLFFAIAAGAAFQVVVEVARYISQTMPLRSAPVLIGFLAGIAVMWTTGLLVG